jgi:hypothetical protein
MTEPRLAELDPAHIVAICARATGGRRSLAVRKADGILVCILPSRRTAYRASAALARVGYDVTGVSADRGRDLLVTGWDPARLETRLDAMRNVLHQLAGNPSLTAKAVIERFRGLPAESQTQQRQWALLNQASVGLRGWVATRSGIHALGSSAISLADTGVALRLRAAAGLEQVIDDQIERQLRVAGFALALFCRFSEQTNGDVAENTAIRWAGIAFHLGSPTGRDSSPSTACAAAPAHGVGRPDREGARSSDLGVLPLTAPGSGRSGPASRIAAEFPRAALAPGQPANVVPLGSARRRTRPGPIPRLHP